MNELVLILIIGIGTWLFRVIFIILPTVENARFKRLLDGVPPAMLVALVIPFAFFQEQQLTQDVPLILSLIVAGWFTYMTRRPGMTLIIAVICYMGFNP